MEGGREGKHGAVCAVSTEEQRNHGSCLLRWSFALCRCLGAGNHDAVRRCQRRPLVLASDSKTSAVPGLNRILDLGSEREYDQVHHVEYTPTPPLPL